MKQMFFVVMLLAALAGTGYAADQRPVYIKTDATSAGAAASTTVVAKHLGAEVYKTMLTCSDTPVTIAYGGAGTNSVGGVKIYDFPAGRILVLGLTVDSMTVTPVEANGFSATDGGDFSFGTAAAAGADLETTAIDLCPKTSIDPIVTATSAALAASAQFDGTTTAKDVYANFLVDANDITNNASLTFDATVTITWMNLGDY